MPPVGAFAGGSGRTPVGPRVGRRSGRAQVAELALEVVPQRGALLG